LNREGDGHVSCGSERNLDPREKRQTHQRRTTQRPADKRSTTPFERILHNSRNSPRIAPITTDGGADVLLMVRLLERSIRPLFIAKNMGLRCLVQILNNVIHSMFHALPLGLCKKPSPNPGKSLTLCPGRHISPHVNQGVEGRTRRVPGSSHLAADIGFFNFPWHAWSIVQQREVLGKYKLALSFRLKQLLIL
jgi:hypothetical protein